ncbi:hypothetical protein PG995_015606 [Apiospora arundinis]|uniref:Uncharacterized protein n=1 Tax=Apiospora arundinis TaxID=335852 RepID=A0ABR2IER2_9PEZI
MRQPLGVAPSRYYSHWTEQNPKAPDEAACQKVSQGGPIVIARRVREYNEFLLSSNWVLRPGVSLTQRLVAISHNLEKVVSLVLGGLRPLPTPSAVRQPMQAMTTQMGPSRPLHQALKCGGYRGMKDLPAYEDMSLGQQLALYPEVKDPSNDEIKEHAGALQKRKENDVLIFKARRLEPTQVDAAKCAAVAATGASRSEIA